MTQTTIWLVMYDLVIEQTWFSMVLDPRTRMEQIFSQIDQAYVYWVQRLWRSCDIDEIKNQVIKHKY